MLEARFVTIAQPIPAPKGGYRPCPFKAGFCNTLDTMERELDALRLRAVERYGASAGGEQYKGWAQLPPGRGVRFQAGEWGSAEDAAQFLIDTAGPECHGFGTAQALNGRLREIYGAAARRAHPDVGGSNELMAKVNRARDFIEAAQAVST